MAAALRHVARRLMAEERRQLFSPSRLMHTREHAREINNSQKKAELYDAILKSRKNPEAISEHDMQLFQRQKVVPEPDDTLWQSQRFATRVNSVLEGIGRMTFYICITALAYGITSDKGAKAQTVDKGSK